MYHNALQSQLCIIFSVKVFMTKKLHNYRSQINKRHREEETHNTVTQTTAKIQLNVNYHRSVTVWEYYQARKDIKNITK